MEGIKRMKLSIPPFFKKALNALLSGLFPEGIKCWCCERELRSGDTDLCEDCRKTIRYAAYHPVPAPLDGLTSAYRYDDLISQPILRFKYNGHTYLADHLAKEIPSFADVRLDVLAPVPLHKKRLHERGYNQSELLCEALSKRWNIPVSTDLLHRDRNTPSQTKLDTNQRKANVKKAFSAKPCKGLTIGLVDDVITSGSTLCACAAALKAAGAKEVYAITVANAMH